MVFLKPYVADHRGMSARLNLFFWVAQCSCPDLSPDSGSNFLFRIWNPITRPTPASCLRNGLAFVWHAPAWRPNFQSAKICAICGPHWNHFQNPW
jgi:hypothetical protein